MEKKKMGRPKKEIDKQQFESLCSMLCTKEEICGFFKCDEKTLSRWVGETYPKNGRKNATFSDVYKKLSANGKISLRRNMFRMSENNASMAIFLAKNILGMSDQQIIAVSDKDDSVKAMGDYFADKKRNT